MISLGLQHFKFLLIVVPLRLKLQLSVHGSINVLWFCILCFRGLSCYWHEILCFLGILLSRPSWEAVLLFFFFDSSCGFVCWHNRHMVLTVPAGCPNTSNMAVDIAAVNAKKNKHSIFCTELVFVWLLCDVTTFW